MPPNNPPRQLQHQEVKNQVRQFPVSILAENISSPQNVGMIFRLAEAFGVEHIFLCGDCAKPPNRKIRKTSRGAEEKVTFNFVQEAAGVLEEKKTEGCNLIGLEITDQSVLLSDFDFSSKTPFLLVLGSEQHGISSTTLSKLDHSVHIPQFGQLSSINVATALGIALYEITGQLSK